MSSSSTCSQSEEGGGRRRGGRLLSPLAIAIAVAALVALGAILAVTLSRGESHSPLELRLQRTHLALVAHQLLALEGPVQREAAAARIAWPSLAKGMPSRPDAHLATAVAAASAAAEAIPTPPFLAIRHELTGPATRVATLFHDFQLLVQQGWSHSSQTIGSLRGGEAAVARFERSNAGLYVDSVYDGNFDASLIGERVLHSYERLGAARAFGVSLTASQVRSIVAVYSPRTCRLVPHLWRELLAQT